MTDHPTTVLMTVDAVGGIWTYALDLGRQLATKNFRVVLAVLGPGLDDAKAKAAADAGLRVVDTGLKPEWLAETEADVLGMSEALVALARAEAIDLVHLNHPTLAAGSWHTMPILVGCHSCVATWWAAVKSRPLPAELRWRSDLVARGYRAARTLVAPSRAFAESTRALYGLDRLPEVVHNGRAPDADTDLSSAPADAVFTAGRLWDEAKNVPVLDRVAALTSVPVRAAGSISGPDGTTIDVENIELLGPLSEAEMRKRFAERPIYVSTALFEPFGLAVLEAAQAGCALVLSDIESFGELWHDAALFVPPNDEEAFAAAIGRLLSDPDLRADYSHAAQNRARAFGLDAFAGDMANLYRGMLGEAGRKDTAA